MLNHFSAPIYNLFEYSFPSRLPMINTIRTKYSFLLLLSTLLLFTSEITASNNEVLVAPIGKQQVVEGGGIRIFFNAFDRLVGGAQFSSTDLPSFAAIIDNGDNTGYIAVNTELGDHGSYLFHLNVSGTAGNTSVPVHLTVIDRSNLGRIFYCDPVNGDMSNVGDATHPWTTLEAVFTSNFLFEDGDVIFLRNGYHGQPQVLGLNDAPVYINAQDNHQPKARNLKVVFANHWVISGLDISPESDHILEKGDYVKLVANVENVVVENCYIYAIDDNSSWTTNQHWYDHCGNGVLNKGSYTTLRNNLIKNTYFSVTIDGEHNHFDFNIVDRYGGDAIRGLKSNNSINHNVITNAVVADYDTGNHDDAFQSWTFSSPVKNIELIGNIVFSCTDPDLPLKTNVLQGIVIFDGFAENWTVENNLVAIDHPHGIALYGIKNSKIANNTVIANPLMLFSNGSAPWIRVNKHKDGRASTGNLIRNNIAGAMILDDTPGTDDHNIVSTNYNQHLRDYENWDFHLLSTGPAIDAGEVEGAPLVDNEGFTRAPTNTPDLGCFEYDASTFDITPPTLPSNLMVIESTNSSIHLSWDGGSDETALAHYIVDYNGKTLSTNDTQAWLCDLDANQNYEISVRAIDYSANASAPLTISTTTPIASGYYSQKINAHQYDQQIRSTLRLEWMRQEELSIGTLNSSYSAVAIIPFQLPFISELDEVKSASFKSHFIGTNGMPLASLSLFGIDASYTNDVEADYFWQGNFSGNTTDYPIQENYVTPVTSPGKISLDSSSMQSFADFINAQYEAGAQAGDYVFLRLNSNTESESSGNYYRFSSADAMASINRPVLELTIVSIITTPNSVKNEVEIIDGLNAFPNPIRNTQNLNISLPQELKYKSCQFILYDYLGRKVHQSFVDEHTTESITINLNSLNLSSGTYLLSAKSKNAISKTKIIIH